jgi:LemA protein
MTNIISLGFLFVLGGVAAYVVMIFNGLIALKNDTTKALANIDILLKQRHDELPNLVEVCKGYKNFEGDTLLKIAQARSLYQQATSVDQKVQADQSVTSALRGFFAVAENYPQLKADEHFLKLQARITELENGIADRREFYNDCVNTLNIRIQQFPDTFIAAFMNLEAKPMFKVEEADKAPVAISFGAAAK